MAVKLLVVVLALVVASESPGQDAALLEEYNAVFAHPQFNPRSALVDIAPHGPIFAATQLDVVDGRLEIADEPLAHAAHALEVRDLVIDRAFIIDAINELARHPDAGRLVPHAGDPVAAREAPYSPIHGQFRTSARWLKAGATVALYQHLPKPLELDPFRFTPDYQRYAECVAGIVGLADHLAEQEDVRASLTSAGLLDIVLNERDDSAFAQAVWQLKEAPALTVLDALDRLESDDLYGYRQAWVHDHRMRLGVWRDALLSPDGVDRYWRHRAARAKLTPDPAVLHQFRDPVLRIKQRALVDADGVPKPVHAGFEIGDSFATCVTKPTLTDRAEIDHAALRHALDRLAEAIDQIDAAWQAGDLVALEAARQQAFAEPTQLGRIILETFGLSVVRGELAYRERLDSLREALQKQAGR